RNQYLDYPHSAYKGMKLVKIPTIKNKYLDSMVHTFISCLHAAPRRYDIVFMMIVGNAPTAIVPRLARQKIVLNVDGLDWRREKCAHHVVRAFNRLRLSPGNEDMKCVIVGDAPYAEEYIGQLKASAGSNVVFTGYCFGEGYRELGSNAYAFVESSGVGGTHPALLEAMGMGNCVVVNGTEENLETIGEAGFSYREPDDEESERALARILQKLVNNPEL